MKPDVDRLLFMAASSFGSAEDRRAFLDYACQGDDSLRTLIDELLEVERDAEEFFELQPEVANPAVLEKSRTEGIGARIGNYRLIDRLGAGGCGVVYLAEQIEPVKRKVALKIIRIGMDTENVIARFVMEREALALMDHPNIARVLDAGATASGRPYFVMELVEGEKITDYCDRNRLGLRPRLELFIQVCEAIQHAHQKGVIHRDIKPSNVLVRDHDGHSIPKVIDFGIAKATVGGMEGDVTVTRSGQFIGTPAYMSPEQAEGSGDIDTRSDIYSLGAMLCELLTGYPPFALEVFKGQGVDQIRGILRDKETGVPSARIRTATNQEQTVIAERRAMEPHRLPLVLAGDLDWIVMKAIEKDRSRRYETANGLALDIQRYLNEEAVLARPPTRRYLFSKLVRRNRILFAAGGVALFGLLAGFGVSTLLFLREREARQEQARLRDVADTARAIAEEARANETRLNRLAQAADLVAQAAVFARYNEMDEADALLAQLDVKDAPATLEAANTLIQAANSNLSKKRWKEAAERFYALVHVFANVDPTDTNANSQEWLPAAPAIIEWGKPGQYEEMRRLAVSRFLSSNNPIVAEHLLKVTLLEPVESDTLQTLVPAAAVIESSLVGPNRQKDAHVAAWAQCVLGLLAYRQGKWDVAEKWTQLSLATTGDRSCKLWNKTILAMTAIRRGRISDVGVSLEEIQGEINQWQNSPLRLEYGHRLAWSNWGSARILLREANELLQARNTNPLNEK